MIITHCDYTDPGPNRNALLNFAQVLANEVNESYRGKIDSVYLRNRAILMKMIEPMSVRHVLKFNEGATTAPFFSLSTDFLKALLCS